MNNLQQFVQLPYTHHTYGIESSENIVDQLKTIIPREECSYIFDRHYDSFKINDARAIKSLQSEKTDKPTVFIISFTIINTEAQNALLKVLEEPTANTYFILVFPNTKKLLPTLQSRLSLVSFDSLGSEKTERNIILGSFLEMNLQERLDIIKKMTDKKSSDIVTKSDVLLFLNDIEEYFHSQESKRTDIAEAIFNAREYVNANGASMKMILDMLAIHV